MANHTPPIVPHVLYVADQNRPWQLAPIERLATRYHTPTTVAVEFGTIDYTVQPQNGKSGVTKQQHHVWCLPNDAAWERVQACRQAYQQALESFADELRRLGGYATRLEERGGLKRAPNPLCPTVIAVDDPDDPDAGGYYDNASVPQIQRETVASHTPKMLHITRDGKPWSTTHQRDHVVCPNDDAWRVVQARQRVAQDAADAWKTLLLQLGTYQRALGDGRYATLAQAALVPAAPAAVGVTMMTRDEAQACVARIAGGIETMRRDLLELYEREGWRALGYDSWRACAVAEFGASAATLYRQLEAAEIERDVRGADFSQVENNPPAIPTVQLQAVKDLPPAERRQAFDRADQLAAGRPRTAADVRQAAQAIRPTDSSIADAQHSNQITQILRTLDQWDEREHTRLLQEAYSHARQIKDETRYAALMAEIDRTVAASAPPQELFAAHGDAMLAAAATLPRTLRLGDGRTLHVVRPLSGGLAYRCADGLAVMASYDVTPHGLLLHVSTSYANRLPSWADLTLIRAAFYPPDLDVIQVLPRAGEYVNVHPYCLHLFAAPEAWQGGWNV